VRGVRFKLEPPLTSEDPPRGKRTSISKGLRDFKGSALGIYMYIPFSKKDLRKLRFSRTGNLALLRVNLAFVVQN